MPIQGQVDTGPPPQPVGNVTNVLATRQGQLHVADDPVLTLLQAILNELRLLRMGMVAADDSVCRDIDELTGLDMGQE